MIADYLLIGDWYFVRLHITRPTKIKEHDVLVQRPNTEYRYALSTKLRT